jgi:hypothetical protein
MLIAGLPRERFSAISNSRRIALSADTIHTIHCTGGEERPVITYTQALTHMNV